MNLLEPGLVSLFPSPWGIVALSLPIMLVPKKEWGDRLLIENVRFETPMCPLMLTELPKRCWLGLQDTSF